MNKTFWGIALCIFLLGCATSHQTNIDESTDSALGLAAKPHTDEATQSLEKLRDQRMTEAQSGLQRQINEPMR